jgi:ubiquinone/menaquinone biosynthesis C-methylase UbiE
MGQADKLFTDGEAYERLMGRWSRLVGETFLDWLDLPNGLQWLDVGCGNGAFTEELIARGAPDTVTAIDPSDDQLAYARTRLGAKAANFRVGDAQKLPFGNGSFDVAIMVLVISFLPDPDKAAAEMARVVRPGGWIATYMWDIPGGGAPTDPIYATLESLGMTSVRPANPVVSRREVMQDLWEKTGLESIDTRVIRIPVVYSDFDDFWDSNTVLIGPQGKLIAGMSTSEREQLHMDLRDRLPTTSDGRIVYESFANAVKGRVPG